MGNLQFTSIGANAIDASPATCTVYRLELTGGKHYVGKTTNLQQTIEALQANDGPEWIRQYPITRVITEKENVSPGELLNVLRTAFHRYKPENVRGDGFDSLELPAAHSLLIRSDSSFQAVTYREPQPTEPCKRCGREGHFANKCTHHTIMPGDIPYTQFRFCAKCGQAEHSDRKYASTPCDAEKTTGYCAYCGMSGHCITECHLRKKRTR